MCAYKTAQPWGSIKNYTVSYALTENGLYDLSDHIWQPLSPGTFNSLTKIKVTSGKSRLVNGWRDPTVFRSYTWGIQNENDGFKYYTRLYGTNLYHKGKRPYLPSGISLASLFASGSGNFPRTSNNLQNQAITECSNKLLDSDTNLLESLFTLNQTIGMIIDSLIKGAKAVKAARKGNFTEVMKILTGTSKFSRSGRPSNASIVDGVSSNWLEYIYGWKPLFNDIAALLELANRQSQNLSISATRKLTEQHSLPSKPPYGVDHWVVSGSLYSGAICRLDANVTNPYLFLFNQLGLLNPLLLGWELIPFSFVIDWFLPIGNVLSALTTGWGLSFKGGSLTTYTSGDVTFEFTEFPMIRGNPIRTIVGGLTTYRYTFGSLPKPRIYWKNPLSSTTRAATALALLTQLRR